MPQGKRRVRQPRGTRIGTHKDKTKTRMEHRAKDRRVQESLSEVRDQQRRLDARIRAEEAQAAAQDRQQLDAGIKAATEQLVANGAPTVTEETLRTLSLEKLKENIEKRALWPLSDARNLVRQGYSVEGTMARTGWPAEMLADVIPGEW